MANLLPIQYFPLATGMPAVGGCVAAYYPGSTTLLKPIYTDSTGTVQMQNPTTAFNSFGMITGGIWGSGLYDLYVFSSTANTTIGQQLYVFKNCGNAADSSATSGGGGGGTTATALTPSLNRIINGNFRLGPNNQLAYSAQTVASGSLTASSWYVLTQTGTITASINTSSPILTTPTSLTINQSTGSAQGEGILQVIPSESVYAMRGQTVQASISLNSNIGLTAYFAILAVSTTNDQPTINVVNSWTNPTLTAGNFFTAAASPITTVANTSLTANTPTTITTSGVVPATATNLLLFCFFLGGGVPNGTLVDFSNVALYESGTALSYRPVHNTVETAANSSYLKTIILTGSGQSALNLFNLSPEFTYYDLILAEVLPSGTNASAYFQVSTDNSSFLGTAIYSYNYNQLVGPSTGTGTGTTTTACGFSQGQGILATAVGSATGRGLSGTIRLYNPLNANGKCRITWHLCHEIDASADAVMTVGTCTINVAEAIKAVSFFYNGINTASGTITVYGGI